MSKFHEDIRQTLIEVEVLLRQTLNKTSLPTAAVSQKNSILKKIDALRENYASLLPPRDSNEQEGSGGSASLSSITGTTTADKEDGPSLDFIPYIPANEITNPSKAGILMKRRKPGAMSPIGAYQKRWCALKTNLFYYYSKQTDKKQAGSFCISGYTFRDAPFLIEKDAIKKELSFELVRPGHRVYQFMANNKDEYNDWKEAVEVASLIPEQATAPETPKQTAEPQEGEELYEPIVENGGNTSADDFVEELYDDIPADQIVNSAIVVPTQSLSVSAKKVPQVPALPPPQPTPTLPPNVPGRTNNSDAPKAPSLPPRNLKAPVELPSSSEAPSSRDDVIYPEFSDWKLGDKCDYENMYYGKWDCEADKSNELSFKRGDIIHVLNKEYDSEQWWIGELNGEVGLVPKIFLVEAYQLVK